MNDEASRVSREEYNRRIGRVLEYAMDHLAADLSLATLAEVACFSPWHFHRIFAALMGETPDDYVRRIRLEKAASRLVRHRDLTVSRVGELCGFSTGALFSRNFARRYGMSPSAFKAMTPAERDERKKRQGLGNERQESGTNGTDPNPGGGYDALRGERAISSREPPEVTVGRTDPVRVAYMWHPHGYHRGVEITSRRMVAWARARELVGADTRLIGIGLDNPDITSADKCRFLVCVTLGDGIEQRDAERLPGRAHVGFRVLSGGLYAVWRSTMRELTDGYRRFYRDWLPDSGYAPADLDDYMVYRASVLDCLPDGRDVVVDVHIPVMPL